MDQQPPTPPPEPRGQDPRWSARPEKPLDQPHSRPADEARDQEVPPIASGQAPPPTDQTLSFRASGTFSADAHPDPYAYPYPYPYAYPYAGQAGPLTADGAALGAPPTPDQSTFGVGPESRPGSVPWGWRQVLLALLIAAGPIVALTVLVLFLPTQDQSRDVSAPAAAFAVVFTILVDGWFVLWAWMFSLRPGRLSAPSWGLRPVGKTIFWLVPVALVAVFIINAGYEAVFQALAGHPTPAQDVVEMFPHGTAGLVLFVLLAVVAAPFFEEVVFRGFIFQGLASSWGTVPGILVSAAVFSATHAQLTVFVPLFILGVVLAWVFYYTRSLWTSIALHAIFNSIAVLVWALSG